MWLFIHFTLLSTILKTQDSCIWISAVHWQIQTITYLLCWEGSLDAIPGFVALRMEGCNQVQLQLRKVPKEYLSAEMETSVV